MTDSPTVAIATDTQHAPLIWRGDHLLLLDQRQLPHQVVYQPLHEYPAVVNAIRDLAVRGAPAIGIAAAYGVVLAARSIQAEGAGLSMHTLQPALQALAAARPTAVNLAWALARMQAVLGSGAASLEALEALALQIHQDERVNNQTMATLGAALIKPGSKVLTICNTGALATGGTGTALAVITEAWRQQRITEVFAAETRPWFQGARLTTWELGQAQVKHRLVVDSAVPWLMQRHTIDWVIAGADRVVANGDTANKIGTYAMALAARAHGVKTMIVIPTSTLDLSLPDGSVIPIEEREANEITAPAGQVLAPHGTAVWNPVFDITPAGLIDALVTERGVVLQPDREKIAALMLAT